MMWANAGSHRRTHRRTRQRVPTSASESESSSASEQEATKSSTSSESEDQADASTSEEEDEHLHIMLSRRKHGYGVVRQVVRNQSRRSARTRDIATQQRLWQSHSMRASKMYPKSLWRVLHAVRLQPQTTQDAVLQACKVMLPRSERKTWPRTRRAIDSTIAKRLGVFHSRVTRSKTIDLSHHQHPSCQTPINFSFLDPIYAWAACALRLGESHKLHFDSAELVDPITGERMYGASVQHGEVMKQACDTRPGAPAIIGINYDAGQASTRRSYTPILITIGNTDYCGKRGCICISYMPRLPSSAPAEAKHELRQAVMKAIIDVIEQCAEHGFTCLLRDDEGKIYERVLFPVLARMEFDTKERTKFFCLARERACGCGSGPRRGHSNFRHCTSHASRGDLEQKRNDAHDPTLSQQERDAAASSLKRRGLNPYQQCTALLGLRHAVLRWPSRIFFGLFSFDVMHGIYLNCIGYLLDTLIDLLPASVLNELDRRVARLPPFRGKGGTTTRRVRRLSSSAYLTAEMKVVHLFVLPHVLGSNALLIPVQHRQLVMRAVVSLQIICYSVRSKRPYTLREHRHICRVVARDFYSALSELRQGSRLDKIARAENYNIDKPPAKRRRVPYRTTVEPPAGESSDTVSSSDEERYFDFFRDGKIIPHLFQHLVDQVRMGGTHSFHDTAGPESSHQDNLKVSGARSRKYREDNRTIAGMMKFNNGLDLIEEICRQSQIGQVPTGQEDANTESENADCDQDSVAAIVKLTNLLQSDEIGLAPLRRGGRGMHSPEGTLHHDVWDRILCEGVPVSLRELVSFAGTQLQLEGEHNRNQLLRCSWTLGWHVTQRTVDGIVRHFWGGGVTPNTTTNYRRGDWVEVCGQEMFRGEMTSRLARIVCGVKIGNIQQVFHDQAIDDSVWETDDCKTRDYAVYLLVRYAAPHAACGRRRGPEKRPLCPGELEPSHCLWKWYERPPQYRRGCWRERPWSRHRHLFGNTEQEQQSRRQNEARAWYDLIKVSDISDYANVSEDWDRPGAFLQSVMWC
jgi:hypothetical protein